MKQVLVVDDEASIVKLLAFNLEKEGFTVTTAGDGQTAYDLAKGGAFDIIILDLMLPKMDGMEVCRELRQNKVQTPILMLTAKDAELDKILGLELGADDYMTKPFSPREVVARLKAILRRSQPHPTEATTPAPAAETPADEETTEEAPDAIIRVGDVVIDTENYAVTVRGKNIDITQREFELLTYMARHLHRTLSREQLLQKIWDFDYTGGTRIVDVHVSHLREKIEADSKNPEYILTVRGFGYKFEEPKQ